MTTLPRFLLATSWGSILAGELIYNAYCHYKMDQNKAPARDAEVYKGFRRLTFQYDPNDYTELGKTYRQRAILSEVIGLVWVCAAPWIIYAG